MKWWLLQVCIFNPTVIIESSGTPLNDKIKTNYRHDTPQKGTYKQFINFPPEAKRTFNKRVKKEH